MANSTEYVRVRRGVKKMTTGVTWKINVEFNPSAKNALNGENNMYEFKTSDCDAIDFYEIAEDLSRQNPICKVEFKDTKKDAQIKALKKQIQREDEDEIAVAEYEAEIEELGNPTRYFVVIHDSLVRKADYFDIVNPDGDVCNYVELDDPSEYRDWVGWAKRVIDAKWPGPHGTVTVTKMEIR